MKYKESENIELKRSTSELKEAIISICSMLNKHSKGTVYFGIENDGKVVGQQIGKSTLKDISKSISDHLEPKIYPDIKTKKIEGKNCIVVNFSGQDGVYSAFGRYHLRMGDEDKKLSVNELRRLVEKKNNYVYSWGSEVSETSLPNADTSMVKNFVERGQKAGRIGFAYDSARNVLHKLNLIKGNKLLNAGQALFCEKNGVEVQAAVFAGCDKITFLDIQSFRGNLFDLIEKSEIYVKEHINWRADLSGSRRIEIPEVPVRAIKEAIINSLCHRDFTNPKSNEIAIYRDRIEIYNPGQFPYDYSPEDFIKGTESSIPRNPLIAETLYRSEDIEKWGSGLRRISQECKAEGVKVEFKKILSGFVVTFYRSDFVQKPSELRGAEQVAEKVAAEGGEIAEKVRRKYGESAEKVLLSIRANLFIKAHEIADGTLLSQRTVEKAIAKLKKARILKRIGADKGGHWALLEPKKK